ncbi:hypothetical protein B566_EDAN007637 [Ephemera danica]|nr:hypothetical protein B566_EDAN007637 [Ephemera danica]
MLYIQSGPTETMNRERSSRDVDSYTPRDLAVMGTTSAGAAGVTCPPPSRWGGGARYLLLLLLLLLLASRADTEKNKF